MFEDPRKQGVVRFDAAQARNGFAAIKQVEAYWEGLRQGRLMPKRSEIDPRGIERALEYAFICERIATGVGRIRVAGSHLNDLLGMEVRGMPLSSLFTPEARKILPDLAEEVFQAPAIADMKLSAEVGRNKPAMTGRMLLLPLESDLGDSSRILGCLITQGDMGRAPRRFDVSEHYTRKLLVRTETPKPEATGDPWVQPKVDPRVSSLRTRRTDQDGATFARKPDREKGHLKLFSFED